MPNVSRSACPAVFAKYMRRACPAKYTKLTYESLEQRCLLTGQTEWVAANPDQTMLVYTPDEFGNRVPDFSAAGFRNGSQDFPAVPVRAVVAADGADGDDSPEIQAAIDRVAQMQPDANGFRGAVLLKAGVHELENSIEILASGIVLRGQYSGSADDPTLNTILVASGTANFGATPFRPVWPNDTVTKHAYQADKFDYRKDFIQLGGSMSLHDLGVTVGQRLIFEESNVNYRVTEISPNGFQFRIDRHLSADIDEGAFIGSSAEGHHGGLVRVNPTTAWHAYRRQITNTGRFHVVDDYVPVGARTVRVAPEDNVHQPLVPGDTVQLIRPGSEAWVTDLGVPFEGDLEESSLQGWTSTEASKYMDRTVTHVETIRDSDHLLVTLDAPITISLDKKYSGSYLDRYHWRSRISNVGVEYIRGIGIPNASELIHQYGDGSVLDQENHAWNFIAVETARDVWVRHVSGEFFANATVFTGMDATVVTVEHAQSLYPVSRITGNRRYAFESLGQRVLFRDVHAEFARHAFITTGSKADMNVFVDSTSTSSFGSSGPHLQLNTAGLLDNVIEEKGITARRTLNGEHGFTGASHVIWNSTIDYSDTLSPLLTLDTDQGTYTLIPTDDTYSTSRDNDSHAHLGHFPVQLNGDFRPHLKFDLSSISDDASITRMELRLSPKIHLYSVDGVFTHELRLVAWDDWTEDTLNTRKDEDGTVVDMNGRPAPKGIMLDDWEYRQNAESVSAIIDASDPIDAYKLDALGRELLDDQLTLRIDPGENANGLAYYHSNERGSKSDQPSFIVENAYAQESGDLIVQNWLIGSSGAIDPTDRAYVDGTYSSAENKVRLDLNGQQYWSLHDAQRAAQQTIDQPYNHYEYREYWLGDTDRRRDTGINDRVQADPVWRSQFMRPSGFDSRPFARVIPFTFEFQGMETGKRVAAASLGLRLVDQTGISHQDSLYLDVLKDGRYTKIRVPFANLDWLQDSSAGDAQSYVLDLGNIPSDDGSVNLLDQLSIGFLNVAVGSMTDVDWAVLNLSVETLTGFHRDLNGDVYYLGNDYANHIRVIDDFQGGIVIEEGEGSNLQTTRFSNVDRLYFYGKGGDDVLDGSRTSLPLFAYGGSGNDRLLGGTRSDWFDGGAGDDILAGFLGGDIYTFDTTVEKDLGRDRVVDFAARRAGSNRLEVKGATYGDFRFEAAELTVNYHQEAWPLLGPSYYEEIVVESILTKPIQSMAATSALAAAMDDDDDRQKRRYRNGSPIRS